MATCCDFSVVRRFRPARRRPCRRAPAIVEAAARHRRARSSVVPVRAHASRRRAAGWRGAIVEAAIAVPVIGLRRRVLPEIDLLGVLAAPSTDRRCRHGVGRADQLPACGPGRPCCRRRWPASRRAAAPGRACDGGRRRHRRSAPARRRSAARSVPSSRPAETTTEPECTRP